MDHEAYYRTMDAIYRIHDDLFHLEDAVLRSASADIHLATLRSQSTLGATIAGFLIVLPIIVSVSGLSWGDVPVVWSVIIAALLVVLLAVQVARAGRTTRELRLARGFYKRVPLERREDYNQERIYLFGMRIRILDTLIPVLSESLKAIPEAETRSATEKRLIRWEEIRAECLKEIADIVEGSETLVRQKLRSEEEHAKLKDWASPFVP